MTSHLIFMTRGPYLLNILQMLLKAAIETKHVDFLLH